MHRLEIRIPDGIPHNGEFLLDGKKLEGLTRVEFTVTPRAPVIVKMEMYVDITIDMTVVERVLQTPEPEFAR